MDIFLQAIRSYAAIPEDVVADFHSIFRTEKYKKNTVLLEAGTVSHEVFFVTRGCLRQYFVNEKGIARTCNFTFEGEFVTDLESFANKTRSTTNIIALEPAECLVATCDDVIDYMSQSAVVSSFFSALVEKIATANIRRIQSLLSRSPEEQFEELIRERPQILQRVSQRFIAEYLGVAPESLSRIRKRMLASSKS